MKPFLPFLVLFFLAAPVAQAQDANRRTHDISFGLLTQADEEERGYYSGVAREMALVLAPLHLGPARTTGHSGFEYTLRFSSHNIHQEQPYWSRVLNLKGGATDVPDTMGTTSIEVRKGLPFGFELGTSLSWLDESETIALGGRLKLALAEGYQHKGVPDLSLHAGVNRMLGSTDLDLTTIAGGATMSYQISAFGRMRFVPFVGYDFILFQAGTHLLINPEYDPDVDQEGVHYIVNFDSLNLDRQDNQWHRARYGLRVETVVGALTFQHDLPILEDSRVQPEVGTVPDQNALSVGLSAHF